MRRLLVKTTASLMRLHGPVRDYWRLGVCFGLVTAVVAGVVVLMIPAAAPVSKVSAGGETIIRKFARAKTRTNAMFAEPTPVHRLLSMALAPMPTIAPPATSTPNLSGLNEIPKELIWNRPPEENDEKRRRSFAAFSKVSEQLPWDAVEPVPFTPDTPDTEEAAPGGGTKQTAAAAAGTRPPLKLARGEIGSWLKAKVTEIKGSERSRPLFHFELWLEPPSTVKGRLVGVSYAFSTPAIRPQSQSSSDRASGFRISAGGLACADEIDLTLRFDDGHIEHVSVDGCKLLS